MPKPPYPCETKLSDEVQQPETTEAETTETGVDAVAAEPTAQVDSSVTSKPIASEVDQSETDQSEGPDAQAVVPSTQEEGGAADSDDDGLAAAEAAMDDEEETVVVAPTGPIEEIKDDDEDIELNWYILKVQSNRERTSSNALKRKIAIEGIENLFGEIIVPTEKVTEFKNGKKKVVERKIWPGYIAVQMHVNDDTWFAIRETAGIGDFTGASGKPIPMQPHEIAMILHQEEEEGTEEAPKLNIKFTEGEKVKVKDGNFENFEGEVHAIDQQSGKVTIMISIFGRSTPVELEYWQVETL